MWYEYKYTKALRKFKEESWKRQYDEVKQRFARLYKSIRKDPQVSRNNI